VVAKAAARAGEREAETAEAAAVVGVTVVETEAATGAGKVADS
jgi:hypothetical protein